MTQPAYLTKGGLERLKEERENLFTVRRHDVAERIQRAKEMGGAVDNAEYEEAKNDQAYIEGRILTLDTLITNARIIEENGSLRCGAHRLHGPSARRKRAQEEIQDHRQRRGRPLPRLHLQRVTHR